MANITLAIHGLLDQQTVLRAGGLYWVTVDQPADAKLLANQFIEAMDERVPATLIACANSPQHLISQLAPDRGPAKLRLYEIPKRVVTSALETLTRELSRAGIAHSSQIVLVLPTDSWGDNATASYLQRWCERMRAWLAERQATLLVIAHGQALPLHTVL